MVIQLTRGMALVAHMTHGIVIAGATPDGNSNNMQQGESGTLRRPCFPAQPEGRSTRSTRPELRYSRPSSRTRGLEQAADGDRLVAEVETGGAHHASHLSR